MGASGSRHSTFKVPVARGRIKHLRYQKDRVGKVQKAKAVTEGRKSVTRLKPNWQGVAGCANHFAINSKSSE